MRMVDTKSLNNYFLHEKIENRRKRGLVHRKEEEDKKKEISKKCELKEKKTRRLIS